MIFFFRFLISFLDECNRVLLTKMLNAEQSDSKNQTQLKEMSNALEEIEKTRKAVKKFLGDKCCLCKHYLIWYSIYYHTLF